MIGALLLSVTHVTLGLWCFQCSEFVADQEKACPTPTTNHTLWSRNTNKYYEITGSQRSCAVGYSNTTGRVYYQSSVTSTECESTRFQTRIVANLQSGQAGGIDGTVSCCYEDGCNWNGTVATSGLSYDGYSNRFSLKSAATVALTNSGWEDWMYILLGCILLLLLLLFCCCCCFFCCCRKKKRDKDAAEGNEEYLGYYYRDRHTGDSAKSKGVPRRIMVASAEKEPEIKVFSNRDHERYSAIDRRIYQRTIPDSSANSDYNSRGSTPVRDSDGYDSYNKNRIAAISREVFDNDEFKQANAKVNPGDKPETRRKHLEWQQVWSKGEPMKDRDYEKFPNANPFRFSEDL